MWQFSGLEVGRLDALGAARHVTHFFRVWGKNRKDKQTTTALRQQGRQARWRWRQVLRTAELPGCLQPKKHTTATAPCLQPLVLDKSPEKDDAAAVKTSQEQFHMCQLGWHAVYKKLVCVLYVIILFL